MATDKQKTKVQFLIEKDYDENDKETFVENHVFAYFPDDVYNHDNRRTCYAHIGQHSGCHPKYAKECKEATPEQYNDLKIELEGLGYSLEIVGGVPLTIKNKKLTYDDIKIGGEVWLSWPYNGSKGIVKQIQNFSCMEIDEPIFHVQMGFVSFHFGLKYILKYYINE
jgi:hypothetical protein